MGTASKYWKLIKLESSGQRRISEVPSARSFFQSAFPEWATETEVSDVVIQQKLVQWYREPETLPHPSLKSTNAQLCLLCFISWEIEQVCLYLEAKYRDEYGVTCQELFPLVLDEAGKINAKNADYQSLAQQILDSFDPQQSGLATWTNRKVKFHPELNTFLLQRGIYMISDWAILNDTRPKQLERILSEVYQRTPFEIQRSVQILSSYHSVYRSQRIQERQTGAKRRCQSPSAEQYENMAKFLNAEFNQRFEPEFIAQILKEIAKQLRDYRIYVRGGPFPTESLSGSEADGSTEKPAHPIEEDESEEFLDKYRQEFISRLDRTIVQVIQQKIKKFKKGKTDKSELFIKALSQFHCQGKSMGEIAKILGIKAQYQVSRLLELKELRADVRQQLLIELRDRILELAQHYTDVQRLQNLDQKIETALSEQIDQMIQEAEAESHNAQESYHKSLFSHRLCEQIDLQFKGYIY